MGNAAHQISRSCNGRWVILHPKTIVGTWLGPPVSASVDMAKLAPLRMILGKPDAAHLTMLGSRGALFDGAVGCVGLVLSWFD